MSNNKSQPARAIFVILVLIISVLYGVIIAAVSADRLSHNGLGKAAIFIGLLLGAGAVVGSWANMKKFFLAFLEALAIRWRIFQAQCR